MDRAAAAVLATAAAQAAPAAAAHAATAWPTAAGETPATAPHDSFGSLWSCDAVLMQARELLTDAAGQPAAADRFRIGHLAALRATAALLSAHTEPGQRLTRRPTSAWVLLPKVLPALTPWAAYFAAGARQRAAADAGVSTAVTDQDAGELLSAASTYLEMCTTLVLSARRGASADDSLVWVPAPPERRSETASAFPASQQPGVRSRPSQHPARWESRVGSRGPAARLPRRRAAALSKAS